MATQKSTGQKAAEQIIDLARRLLGLPPRRTLAPVPVRSGRPAQYRLPRR